MQKEIQTDLSCNILNTIRVLFLSKIILILETRKKNPD